MVNLRNERGLGSESEGEITGKEERIKNLIDLLEEIRHMTSRDRPTREIFENAHDEIHGLIVDL